MLKYFFRLGLIAALAAMTYVAVLPAYDFSRWVPATFLSMVYVPQLYIKLLSIYADKIAHMVGAFVITYLYFLSLNNKITSSAENSKAIRISPALFITLLLGLASLAELAQLWVGRRFSLADIFAGVFGGVVALLCLNYTNTFKPAIIKKV